MSFYLQVILIFLCLEHSITSGMKIKPPIPQELKKACANSENRQDKRNCLNEQLKEYCNDESNIDTITCKVVRLKTLIPDSIAGTLLRLRGILCFEILFSLILSKSSSK